MNSEVPTAEAANSAAHCPALFVSAIASGQGKTSVTAALARFHSRTGRTVRVFKTGPDFLDPKILEVASGAPVFNLDCWMVGIEQSRALLAEAAQAADLILIEGAMGLFDGDPSAADLAALLGVPVAAIIDASAMAQTFGAVAHGLQSYRAIPFAGVIANRVAGALHAQMLIDSLRPGMQLIAALPRVARSLPERHLGLIPDEDGNDVMQTIDMMADAIADSTFTGLPPPIAFPAVTLPGVAPVLMGRTIAIARDAAFCFIYPANLRCLRELGAGLVFFSPLADEPVPLSDALYLPGGYPELHAAELSRNERWTASVREYAATNRPIVGECGGMMAMVETLTTTDGERYRMAGLLPGTVVMRDRLSAIGLHTLPMPDGDLRGHTFHHSRLQTSLAPSLQSIPHRYGSGEFVYVAGAITVSYVHAYFQSNPLATAALFGVRAS